MKVCVLGCGPAGLLAAYACDQRRLDVSIISAKTKSKIPGAVYLHEPIPPLTAPTPDGMVNFIKQGDKPGYAEKVYGYRNAECSWDQFPEGERPAWSMFDLYDKLWSLFQSSIEEQMILSDSIPRLYQRFDLIISTIPALWLCHNSQHRFPRQEVVIMDKAIDKSLTNGIIYNGKSGDHWYRTSNIFGSESTESTKSFSRRLERKLGAKSGLGYKPIQTNCDCYPQVARVGRFGLWRKGVLVHHAYKQTIELLEGL